MGFEAMNDEWYTPEYIVQAARKTMGSIDTDPASCEFANKVVKAGRFYTKEEDGLDFDWHGNVFLNPPYSKGLCARFVNRAIHCENPFQNAIVLTNSATSTEWYHRLLRHSVALCLLNKRVRFYRPDGLAPDAPRYDQSVFLMGKRETFTPFQFWFLPHGHIVKL